MVGKALSVIAFDESKRLLWDHPEPFENWRQVSRKAAALAVRNRAAGAVHQLKVVLRISFRVRPEVFLDLDVQTRLGVLVAGGFAGSIVFFIVDPGLYQTWRWEATS